VIFIYFGATTARARGGGGANAGPGACRLNWTKAIDAPMATVKQQTEKAFAAIKELLNEISAYSGPSTPFEGP